MFCLPFTYKNMIFWLSLHSASRKQMHCTTDTTLQYSPVNAITLHCLLLEYVLLFWRFFAFVIHIFSVNKYKYLCLPATN